MKTQQFLASAIVVALSATSAGAAYDEIECSTDAVFSANSCDQCFEWGQTSVNGDVGFIDDEWVNVGNSSKVMFKEEQAMPRMLSLNGSNWSQSPSADNFWEWTPELEALYSESEQGYVLGAGQRVKFIQSAVGRAYTLDSTEAGQGENVGLLVVPLLSHVVMEDGDISTDDAVHNECALFKAWAEAPVNSSSSGTPSNPSNPTPEPKEMAQVETWAEAYLILLFALILGFVYLKTRRHA